MLSVETIFQEVLRTASPRRRRLPSLNDADARRVLEEIAALPEQSRLCLALRFYESLPPAVIAGVLSLPVSDVETILAEAGHRVMERLKGEGEPAERRTTAASRRRRSQER